MLPNETSSTVEHSIHCPNFQCWRRPAALWSLPATSYWSVKYIDIYIYGCNSVHGHARQTLRYLPDEAELPVTAAIFHVGRPGVFQE